MKGVKMTYKNLENMYKKNPLRIFYCIRNPEMVDGEIKNTCFDVEKYQIDKFKNKKIYFKKISDNKTFPEILEMPYFIDSESELFDNENKNTYSIFDTETKAKIQKAERLDRFLNSLKMFYDKYEEYKNESMVEIDDENIDEKTKEVLKEILEQNKNNLPSKEKIEKMIKEIEKLNLEEILETDDFLLNYL
jgi:hypothetical protein